jgi:hypothetical protein
MEPLVKAERSPAPMDRMTTIQDFASKILREPIVVAFCWSKYDDRCGLRAA